MPVRGGKSIDGICDRASSPAADASRSYTGPYDQLGRSYAKVLDYVREKGYEVLVPTREIYHKGPGMIFRGNPKNYLTEIQMLIAGGSGGRE